MVEPTQNVELKQSEEYARLRLSNSPLHQVLLSKPIVEVEDKDGTNKSINQ